MTTIHGFSTTKIIPWKYGYIHLCRISQLRLTAVEDLIIAFRDYFNDLKSSI
jgi:hypothetical protein